MAGHGGFEGVQHHEGKQPPPLQGGWPWGWGIVDGLIFDNWREEAFDYLAISKKPDVKSAFGLDFGYTNDPTALFCGLVSEKERTIWVLMNCMKRPDKPGNL